MRYPAFLQRLLQTKLGRVAVQFIKFGMVGVLNTAISLIAYYIFLRIDSELYLIGNVVGFLVSTLNAYWLNHKYVFVKKGVPAVEKKTLVKTYLAYGFSLTVSTGLLYLLVNILQVGAKLAPLCCLLVTVPLNYLVNKFWVYQSEEG